MTAAQRRAEWAAYGIALCRVVGRGPIYLSSAGNLRMLRRFSFRYRLERLRLFAAVRRGERD